MKIAIIVIVSVLGTAGLLVGVGMAFRGNALAGTSVPSDPGEESGCGLAERVEEFAGRFWSLPTAVRRAEWTRLSNQAGEHAHNLPWAAGSVDAMFEV